MIEETLPLKGEITYWLYDSFGNLKETDTKKNLIVTTGKNFAANALIASSTSPFTNMAIGTGTNGAALSDTALQTELSRVAFSSATAPANVAVMTATFGAGVGTGAITEAGLFNNTVGGTMFSRISFSVINKAASDTLTIAWSITAG